MNARLRSENPAGYALDATHAPHITLAQRYVRRDDLPRIEAAVAAVLARDRPIAMKLRAHGYAASDFGGGLLLLDVARTPELDTLAADVLAGCNSLHSRAARRRHSCRILRDRSSRAR
jgi:hypothetical protein